MAIFCTLFDLLRQNAVCYNRKSLLLIIKEQG